MVERKEGRNEILISVACLSICSKYWGGGEWVGEMRLGLGFLMDETGVFPGEEGRERGGDEDSRIGVLWGRMIEFVCEGTRTEMWVEKNAGVSEGETRRQYPRHSINFGCNVSFFLSHTSYPCILLAAGEKKRKQANTVFLLKTLGQRQDRRQSTDPVQEYTYRLDSE